MSIASLNNKVVVVLGGTSGIGLAVAQAAALGGAKVRVASRDPSRVAEAVKEARRAVEELNAAAIVVVTAPADRGYRKSLGDKPLRSAFAIHLGRIDQGHAELDAEAQSLDLLRPASGILRDLPGPLPERRNNLAIRQRDGEAHMHVSV